MYLKRAYPLHRRFTTFIEHYELHFLSKTHILYPKARAIPMLAQKNLLLSSLICSAFIYFSVQFQFFNRKVLEKLIWKKIYKKCGYWKCFDGRIDSLMMIKSDYNILKYYIIESEVVFSSWILSSKCCFWPMLFRAVSFIYCFTLIWFSFSSLALWVQFLSLWVI